MGKISTGSSDLNKWLCGGYERDVVSVLYGGPGSGKTNLCMMVAVSQARKGNKVVFIDTEGGFSIDRVKQLLTNENCRGDFGIDETLKNILLLKPTNFSEQKKAFDRLLKYLANEISLIVVDSMTILYRLEFADARDKSDREVQKINAQLVEQIRTLSEISRKREIPTIVTNQVYKWQEKQNMVGGDILKYWSKCLIELEKNKGRRTIYLRKHRSFAEKGFTFQIYDGGIRKRGWI